MMIMMTVMMMMMMMMHCVDGVDEGKNDHDDGGGDDIDIRQLAL